MLFLSSGIHFTNPSLVCGGPLLGSKQKSCIDPKRGLCPALSPKGASQVLKGSLKILVLPTLLTSVYSTGPEGSSPGRGVVGIQLAQQVRLQLGQEPRMPARGANAFFPPS